MVKLSSNIYAIIRSSAAFAAVLMSSSDKVLSNDTDSNISGDQYNDITDSDTDSDATVNKYCNIYINLDIDIGNDVDDNSDIGSASYMMLYTTH